jgi:predicted RNA-binding Zn-ribbon protein involved in translation (DUF1610 family)
MEAGSGMDEDERYRLRACEGKKPYASYSAASHALKEMRKIHKSIRVAQSVYRCKSCGAFHFGRVPERTIIERRERKRKLERLYGC